MKTKISLIMSFCCVSIFAQKSFFYEITTSIGKNEKIEMLFIEYDIAGIIIKDSLQISQAKLRNNLPQPISAKIYTNNKKIQPIFVMLANNNLTVSIVENNLSVEKSKLQEDFLFLTKNDRIRPQYFPLYGELSAKNDTIELKKLGVLFENFKNEDILNSLNYFKSNKTSLLSLFAFNRYTTFYADYSKVSKDFELLPTWAKNSPDGKNISAKIAGAKSMQINSKTKEFEQKNSKGQRISLNNFKGKYILLDFWASWCAPCRKEHPNLIKIYENNKNNNFDIISVSLDSSKENWLDAIDKDNLTWTQLSDLKGQQNEIAVKYGVQSVPANFLINPNGIIIAKNIKPEELDEKLKTLLTK